MQDTLTTPAKRLMTPKETAEFLAVEVQTLAVWRSTKRHNLPYVRCGNSIRYRLADLEAWLASRTVSSVKSH